MLLYLYDKSTGELCLTEEAASYDADTVYSQNGKIILNDSEELSLSPELNQTLRADYRLKNPKDTDRIRDLEAILAEMLFGGDAL